MDTRQTCIGGLWLPLVTPFRDGEIDLPSMRRMAAHYAGQAVDGFILAATTGEGLTLDAYETRALVAAVAEELDGRLPVYLGLCGADTRDMAGTLGRTAGWEIDGYLIACPYYSRPSQEGLYRHFAALAGGTDGRILIYNIPYRTGVNLANDTLLRLAELPNIVGVKDCCADAAQSFDLLRTRPPGFAVLTGEDALFHAALSQGADGGILAAAHVRTGDFARVRAAMAAGDPAAALRLWRELVDLARLLFAEPNPAPVKHWLWRQGLIASPELRLPMTGVSPALAARLDRALAAAAGAGAGEGEREREAARAGGPAPAAS